MMVVEGKRRAQTGRRVMTKREAERLERRCERLGLDVTGRRHEEDRSGRLRISGIDTVDPRSGCPKTIYCRGDLDNIE
jgi:hypothetical protein